MNVEYEPDKIHELILSEIELIFFTITSVGLSFVPVL